METDKILKKLELLNEGLIYLFIIFLFMDKGETLRIIGIYLPFIFLITKSIILRQIPFHLNNFLFILFLTFCFSGILASIFAPSFLYSLEWFKKTYLKLFLVSIVFLVFFQSKERIIKLTYLCTFMALIFIILTYYDFYTKILMSNQDYGRYIRKYIVPLEVFLPFVFYLLIDRKKIFKYIGLLTLIFGIVAVILTGSRGGWISVFVGFFICAYFYLYLKKINLKKAILIIFGIFLAISILFAAVSPSYVYVKFDQLKRGDTSLRIDIVWPAAIDNYLDLPLLNKIFGNGLGRMTYLEDFKKWYLKKFNYEPTELYSPHNFYLSILYKQGILGLIIFLIFITVLVKTLINTIKLDKYPLTIRCLSVCILAVLIGILIHSFVEDTRFIQWMFVIPITIGFVNYTKTLTKQ